MNEGAGVIEFHLDAHSGVAPYLQLIHQARQALRLDLLSRGDQLPTVKDVVGRLAINPNTVLKAYRELEYEGLVSARPGIGTFVTKTLRDASLAAHGPLRQGAPGRARRREHRGALPGHLSVRQCRRRSVSAVLETNGLGKRYGRHWALSECTLEIPAGRVAAL